jgi:hypothetical protein
MGARSIEPWLYLIAILALGSPALAWGDSDEDFGFNGQVSGARVGWLTQRAFSPRDEDAIFIINDVPMLYRRPKNVFITNDFDRRFGEALTRALANARSDPKSLAIILEGAACFYRKMNRAAQSLELLKELVELTRGTSPDTDDLCNAQIACTKCQR